MSGRWYHFPSRECGWGTSSLGGGGARKGTLTSRASFGAPYIEDACDIQVRRQVSCWKEELSSEKIGFVSLAWVLLGSTNPGPLCAAHTCSFSCFLPGFSLGHVQVWWGNGLRTKEKNSQFLSFLFSTLDPLQRAPSSPQL